MNALNALIKEVFNYQMSIDGSDAEKAAINTVHVVLDELAKARLALTAAPTKS